MTGEGNDSEQGSLPPVVALAACGSLPLEVLQRVCGHAAIRQAEDDGALHIEAVAGNLVSPAGEKAELGTTELVRVRQRVGRALVGVAVDNVAPAVIVRLAELLEDAGVYDFYICRNAIRAALMNGDAEAALRTSRFGLSHDATSLDLLHLQAMALESLGRHGAATGLDSTNAALKDPAWLGRWASNLFLSTGRVVQVDQLPVVADAEHERDASLAWIQTLEGNVATVAEIVNRIIDDPRASPQAVVWACVAGAVPAALDGRSEIATALIAHCRSLMSEVSDQLSPFAELQIGLVEALALTRLGKLAQAASLTETQIDAADSHFLKAVWSYFGGIARREMGDFEAGLTHFSRGLQGVESDPFGLIQWAHSEAAVCATLAGTPTDLPVTDIEAGHGLYSSCLHRNSAWIYAAQGHVDAAIESIDEAIEHARSRGQNVHLALALLDLARFGEPRRATTLLTSLTEVDAPIVTGAALSIQALADDDFDSLVTAHAAMRHLQQHVQADELLYIARHKAERSGEPAQVARLDLLAVVKVRPTPIFSTYRPVAFELTAREREVARPCAQGASSRDIASTLDISVRTVDNLLGRVYRKCAFTDRRDLQSWWIDDARNVRQRLAGQRQ